ncbi:MAG: divalent cation tolerance protein CutA [Thermoplasmata archaeon]
MSPYPMEPADARGPMRLVITTYPDPGTAQRESARILRARLAACADRTTSHASYWWRESVVEAAEVVVTFKTVPKLVGALFRAIAAGHPYEVPLIVEVDLHRVHGPYLAYLARVLDPASPPPPLGGGTTRRGSPRARGAPSPRRTRAPRPRRSRGTGRRR